MKKGWIWLIMLALPLCSIATGLYAFADLLAEDKSAPTITVAEETLELSVMAEESALLQGISAWDNRDGDVTSNMVVEGISNVSSDGRVKVTYAAFDRAGNVAKVTRNVQYTDYSSPVFGLKRALVFGGGSTPDVTGYMTAEDVVDGRLDNRIKGTLVSDTNSLSYAGLHEVEFRVTNSLGDTARIKLPVEIYPANEYNAMLELTDYLVYVKKGSAFDAKSYLKALSIGAAEYSLKEKSADVKVSINGASGLNGSGDDVHFIKVDMEDAVDTMVPGIYSVTYKATMDERYAGYTRLNVVVEE